MIYYISERNIYNLYQERMGELISKKEKTFKVTAGINLLSNLISGNVNENSKHIIETTSTTIALKIIKEMAKSLEDVLLIVSHKKILDIYKFRLLMRIKYNLDTKANQEGNVEVYYEDEQVVISGDTSKANWASASILNNMIEENIMLDGILYPVSITEINEKLRIKVQFLVIGKSLLGE